MVDETKDIAVHWENLPQKAKMLVYEHLRATIAQFERDAAMSALVQDVAHSTSGGNMPPLPMGAAQQAAAMAFHVALSTLEEADGELCLDCGTYHDEDTPHPPPDPRDLS